MHVAIYMHIIIYFQEIKKSFAYN